MEPILSPKKLETRRHPRRRLTRIIARICWLMDDNELSSVIDFLLSIQA